MVSIASLLNPLPPSLEDAADSVATKRETPSSEIEPSTSSAPMKYKMSKSAAIFVKGKAKGVINYKPCEIQDEIIAAEHQRLKVEPIGHIGDYPRHIPYNSDKKTFQQRTGRDAFEAYQYTFRMPGDDPHKEPHAMMWDYNVGLVRITALFKSLKHSKTMPAKVMNANSGLREISHSITGGSIGAQGYWVPFEAAKAVAATFCHEIRYALTPVFGLDFPDLCTEPGDPAFMRLNIDPAIVTRCEEAAYLSFRQSQEASRVGSPRAPRTRTDGGPQWTPRSLRPKTTDSESGYGTDSDRSPFESPPRSMASNPWTPVNIPRSTTWAQYQFPSPAKTPVSSPTHVSATLKSSEKRMLEKGETTDQGFVSDASSKNLQMPPKRRKISMRVNKKKLTQEALAARALMELHRADLSLGQRVRVMSRRASA